MALAWIYALMLTPLTFSLWSFFETVPSFFFLLGLTALVEGRSARAGAAIGLGAASKYVPLALLPTAWKFRPRREALIFSGLALALAAALLAPVALLGGEMGRASLAAQALKPSYETIWALIDGNWGTGIFGAPAAHFDPDNVYHPQGNPPLIPSWARLLVFGGLGLWIFSRPLRRDDLGAVAFAAITLVIFCLWAQGWSPQWQVLLLPLVLLCFPERVGVLFALAFSFVNYLEYPVLIGHYLNRYIPFTIVTRTIMLGGLALALYRLLRPTPLRVVAVGEQSP